MEEKLQAHRDEIVELWDAVGKLKNPYPNYSSVHSDSRKGFSKAKRLIRQMLWKKLINVDSQLIKLDKKKKETT